MTWVRAVLRISIGELSSQLQKVGEEKTPCHAMLSSNNPPETHSVDSERGVETKRETVSSTYFI